MSIFNTIGSEMSRAVDFVMEKNRKTALINRIRIVIKNERENTARAYVALGKYYYEKMRDPENEQTEYLCKSLDESARRMKKAFDKLDELTAPALAEENACEECGSDDCAACPYYEDDDLVPCEIAADPDNTETDLPEPPFINPLHDEAAAQEEQELADAQEAPKAPDAPEKPFIIYSNGEEAAKDEE